MGVQGMGSYFDYLLYELTGDRMWRQRAFEQMDFILKGQNTDPTDFNYGAVHTTYSLTPSKSYGPTDVGFNSDDRWNIGYKPDIDALLARYMLQMWKRVKEHEGVDRQDWYKSAILAVDWIMRQQNNDGGLPQKVQMKPLETRWFADGELVIKPLKSRSSTSGRALPAFWHIYKITGDPKYKRFMEELEEYTLNYVQNKYYYTSHHPDLPPYEFEEASIWGVCEYWLNRYEDTGDEKYLKHAVADAYLALTWWVPKQLSWVKNPTQGGSAEQQHYLSLVVYCYQNRKIECLKRLYDKTKNPLFNELFERMLQNIYFTQQTTEDGRKGGTYERTSRPWRVRKGKDGKPDFNSLGAYYLNEQALDCFVQIFEMFRTDRGIYYGENVKNKIYPDGVCYYSKNISKQKRANLSVLPSTDAVFVTVNSWINNSKKWIAEGSADGQISITHTAGDLEPNVWHEVYDNGELSGRYQSNNKGIITFTYSGNLSSPHIFEIKVSQ